MARKKIILSDRDLKILRFVGKNRAVLFEVLHTRFFKGMHIDALKSTLRRLRGPRQEPRFLRSYRLPDGRVFYQLTYQGTRIGGCSPAVARPIGVQARASRFAVQWFIFVDGGGERLAARSKDLGIDSANPIFQASFFVEGFQLGFVLLDCAEDIRIISHKVAAKLDPILQHHWFDDYIAARAFTVVILTLSNAKKRDIETRLPTWLWSRFRSRLGDNRIGIGAGQNIQLKVLVVPGLANLVPSKDDKR